MRAIVWALGLSSASYGLVALLEKLGRADGITQAGLGAVLCLVFSWFLLNGHAPERELRDALGLRPTSRTLFILSIWLGLALALATDALWLVAASRFPLSETALVAETLARRADSTQALLVRGLVAGAVAPMAIEVFARGALFTQTRRHASGLVTALVCALCIVPLRLDPRWLPGALVVGLALGHVRAASGSLAPAIALHVAYSITLAELPLPGRLNAVMLLSCAAAGALSLAIEWVAKTSEEAERARAEDLP